MSNDCFVQVFEFSTKIDKFLPSMKYTHLLERKKKKVTETQQRKTLWLFMFHIKMHCLCHLLLQKVYLVYPGKSAQPSSHFLSRFEQKLRHWVLALHSQPWRVQASLHTSRLHHPFFQEHSFMFITTLTNSWVPNLPGCRYLITHQQVTRGTEAEKTAPQCKAFLGKKDPFKYSTLQ